MPLQCVATLFFVAFWFAFAETVLFSSFFFSLLQSASGLNFLHFPLHYCVYFLFSFSHEHFFHLFHTQPLFLLLSRKENQYKVEKSHCEVKNPSVRKNVEFIYIYARVDKTFYIKMYLYFVNKIPEKLFGTRAKYYFILILSIN